VSVLFPTTSAHSHLFCIYVWTLRPEAKLIWVTSACIEVTRRFSNSYLLLF
jgi:hypothetical protein